MKKTNKQKSLDLPTTKDLENQLNQEKYNFKYKKILKSTIYALIIVASISTLAATLIFPVLRIYGSSMSPTLIEGDIVISIKKTKFKKGDIIAFYYNNHILVKRVIATSSDWVNIDLEGNIYINNKLIEENYIEEKSFGESNIEFPYQVPEGTYFILGDKRNISIDSRNSLIGTIPQEEIIGKIIFRVWPLKRLEIIK